MTSISYQFSAPLERATAWLLALFPLLYWALLALAIFSGAPVADGRVEVWLFICVLWSMRLGARSADVLARGARVFSGLRSPAMSWVLWRRQALKAGTMSAIGLVAGTLLVFAAHTSPVHWLWATGSVALAWGASFCVGAWRSGVALGALSGGGPPRMRHRSTSNAGLWGRWKAFGRRHIQLELLLTKPDRDGIISQNWARQWLDPVMPSLTSFPLIMLFASETPMSWLRLLFIPFLACQYTFVLTVRDLHWRFLLLPGGQMRGRFGRKIFAGTLTIQTFVWVSALCIYWSVKSIWSAQPLVDLMAAALQSSGMMIPEFLAIIAFAVAIRAVGRLAGPFIGLFLAATGTALWLLGAPLKEPIHISPAMYGMGLLLVGATAVAVADRLWTTRKLMPQML